MAMINYLKAYFTCFYGIETCLYFKLDYKKQQDRAAEDGTLRQLLRLRSRFLVPPLLRPAQAEWNHRKPGVSGVTRGYIDLLIVLAGAITSANLFYNTMPQLTA